MTEAEVMFGKMMETKQGVVETVNSRDQVNGSMVSAATIPWLWLELHECEEFGGHLSGVWCNYVPDVFFFSVLLFFGTYIMATYLKQFKTTPYLPTKVKLMC